MILFSLSYKTFRKNHRETTILTIFGKFPGKHNVARLKPEISAKVHCPENVLLGIFLKFSEHVLALTVTNCFIV